MKGTVDREGGESVDYSHEPSEEQVRQGKDQEKDGSCHPGQGGLQKVLLRHTVMGKQGLLQDGQRCGKPLPI